MSNLTKNHFEMLARNNANILESASINLDENYIRGILLTMRSTAGIFQEIYPRFEMQKYLEASGYYKMWKKLNMVRMVMGKRALEQEVNCLISSNELKRV